MSSFGFISFIKKAGRRSPLLLAALLFACAPSPEDIRVQIEKLGDPLAETTRAAQEKLGAMGDIVIPEIASLCRDVEDPVSLAQSLKRTSACRILGTSLGNEPEAASLLLELTSSRDGILRRNAIQYLRSVWGKEVEKALSAEIVAALSNIIAGGNREELRIYEYDASDEKARAERKGTPPLFGVFHDFDITAVETLAVMYSVQKERAPAWGLLCKNALEKALAFPRVKEQAQTALDKY
jgi:hypothetical protein